MKAYSTVEEYFKDVPADKIATLEKLRKTIRSVIPGAEEYISYGIPTFRYGGRAVISYAAFKDHCSLFPLNSTVIKENADALKEFKTSKGTIQFTVDKQLPVSLVIKIVKERMKQNEQREFEKKTKK